MTPPYKFEKRLITILFGPACIAALVHQVAMYSNLDTVDLLTLSTFLVTFFGVCMFFIADDIRSELRAIRVAIESDNKMTEKSE